MTAEPELRTVLRRLTKRREFLHAAQGDRAGRPGFTLQAIAVEGLVAGVGFTVTKKTGNAPQRNRIKRRLRAAARACGDEFQPQHDYVLVGRREALTLPYAKVVADLSSAIHKVHAKSRVAGTQRP
ncbi:MAG TPA: ribonuclease P protein component [Devosia sp.]|jgi:ribonuclease P protein component|nr:ribonuclease P protein component [Devosia sp.]